MGLEKFLSGDENASPKIPHGAYSFPLAPIFRDWLTLESYIKYEK